MEKINTSYVSCDRIGREGYKANIERRYRNLPTEKLREIVVDYKSRSFLEKIFCFSSAEKIEIGVARKILIGRDKIIDLVY